MPEGYPFRFGYQLIFEKGVIEYCSLSGDIVLYEEKANSTIKAEEYKDDFEIKTANPYTEEIRHFINAIKEKKPFRSSAHDAAKAVELVTELRVNN